MLFFMIDEMGAALEAPVTVDVLRKRVTNVSFPKEPTPEFLRDIGYGFIDERLNSDDVLPSCEPGQTIELGVPIKIGEQEWKKTFTVVRMSQQEAAYRMKELRERRNRLLVKSDFTQLADFQENLSELGRQEWKEYRQYLRDLPATVTNLKNIKWKTPPSPI